MKKTIISTLIVLSIIGAISLLMSFKAPADSGYIILRVFESHLPSWTSKISVSEGAGVINTIEMDLVNAKSPENNINKIASALTDLKSKGYSVVTSNTKSEGRFFITDYLLEKK